MDAAVNIHVPGMGSYPMPAAVATVENDLPVADWRGGLPTLVGERVTLRELRASDASTMYAELTTPEASKFMWSPPPNVWRSNGSTKRTTRDGPAANTSCLASFPSAKGPRPGASSPRSSNPDSCQ